MSTLELAMRTVAGKTTMAGRVVLTGLRTFSGLAMILVGVLFVIFNDGDAGGAANTEAAEPSRRLIVRAGGSIPSTSELVFYLVETQAQADLIAAEDYETWAASKDAGFDRQIHILFARDATEEITAHRFILQRISDSRLPRIVSIFDRRGSGQPALDHVVAGGAH